MNDRKRVILVSELFYPDETSTAHILTRIATYLSKDFDVLVLAGPKSYEVDTSRIYETDQNLNGIQIARAWAPRLDKNHLLSRVARLMVLSLGMALLLLAKSKRGDVVLSVTNPAPLLILTATIRKLRNFSLALLVHDVFPENAVAAGLMNRNSISFKTTKFLFDWAYGAADSIIAIGRDMAEIIADKVDGGFAKISIIENWADLSVVTPIPRTSSRIETWGLSDKVVIQYAGNIGRAQGIMEFLDLTTSVKNKAIHYVFAGSGALLEPVRALARNSDNLTLIGSFSRADQNVVLGSCDIALVILGEDMYGLGVPSKAYNIMAAGKPILFIGPKDSEIYRLVRDSSIGWAFSWEQSDDVVSFLNLISGDERDALRTMGERARSLAEKSYSESAKMEQFGNVIRSLS